VSLQQAIQDLESLEPVTREFIVEHLDSLMNEYVVFECVAAAKASNLPLEFIAGIAWKRTGDLSGRIINTWGSPEKPLAKWFNDGTPDHWIEPLGVVFFLVILYKLKSSFSVPSAKREDPIDIDFIVDTS